MTKSNPIQTAAGTANMAFSRIRSATSGSPGLVMPDIVLDHIATARAALDELETAAREESARRAAATAAWDQERKNVNPEHVDELARRREAQADIESRHQQNIANHNTKRGWWRQAS